MSRLVLLVPLWLLLQFMMDLPQCEFWPWEAPRVLVSMAHLVRSLAAMQWSTTQPVLGFA